MTWTQPLQIDSIRAILGEPSLELWVTNEPVSAGENSGRVEPAAESSFRARIRDFLIANWRDEFSSIADIRDLTKRPSGKKKSFSISHCPGVNGVAVCEKLCGLDLERASRVKESIARRVSVVGEMESTPSPAHLWVAKESFFKAIPETKQPATISEIEISAWGKNEDGSWSYSARSRSTEAQGYGAVVSLGGDILCGLSLAT